MSRRAGTGNNGKLQATVLKKCDRAFHRPETNRQGAGGTCQHTCEPSAIERCNRLPDRVKLNISGKNGKEGYARYWKYPANTQALQTLIQDAYDARTTRDHLIELGRTRRINNSPCP